MIDLLENNINKQILIHLSNGLSVKQASDKVCLSRKAVEKRIWNMKQHAGAKNITELIVYCVKNKILISSN